MTPGNVEFVQVVTNLIVTLVAVPAIIVGDERRLCGEELARAWPPVSRDAAIFGIYAYGIPVCLIVHFSRTRRSMRGFLIGVLWFALVYAVLFALDALEVTVIDWLGV